MIRSPLPGDRVRLHYAARAWRLGVPEGAVGVVVVVARGRGPRNVAVRLRGGTVVVPRGNLEVAP